MCLVGVIANFYDLHIGAVCVANWLIVDCVICTMHVGMVCWSKGAGAVQTNLVITHTGFDVICGSMVKKEQVLVGVCDSFILM